MEPFNRELIKKEIYTAVWNTKRAPCVSFLADRRLPVAELDQKSISDFLFNTGKTVKVHSVLWNGDMVGMWGGEERSGVKPEIKLCRLSRNRGGGLGDFVVRNPSNALPEPGRRKQLDGFAEMSHGKMCLKNALNQLCVVVPRWKPAYVCYFSSLHHRRPSQTRKKHLSMLTDLQRQPDTHWDAKWATN